MQAQALWELKVKSAAQIMASFLGWAGIKMEPDGTPREYEYTGYCDETG